MKCEDNSFQQYLNINLRKWLTDQNEGANKSTKNYPLHASTAVRSSLSLTLDIEQIRLYIAIRTGIDHVPGTIADDLIFA